MNRCHTRESKNAARSTLVLDSGGSRCAKRYFEKCRGSVSETLHDFNSLRVWCPNPRRGFRTKARAEIPNKHVERSQDIQYLGGGQERPEEPRDDRTP